MTANIRRSGILAAEQGTLRALLRRMVTSL